MLAGLPYRETLKVPARHRALIEKLVVAGYVPPLSYPLGLKQVFDFGNILQNGKEAKPTRLTEMFPLAARLLGIDPEDEIEAMLSRSV